MTLVGLLPPLCDNGSMLVDGGYSRWPYLQPGSYADLFTVDNLTVGGGRFAPPCAQLTNSRSLPCLPWVQAQFLPAMLLQFVLRRSFRGV